MPQIGKTCMNIQMYFCVVGVSSSIVPVNEENIAKLMIYSILAKLGALVTLKDKDALNKL